MLEANTFRLTMMVAGVMAAALLMGLVFYVPMVDMDASAKANYEDVMNVELEPGTDKLSPYEAIEFSIKAKTRGNVNHY